MKEKKRGLLVSAGALLTAAALALTGAAAASAAPGDPVTDMPERSAVVITKLEQPATPGSPASGLQQSPTDARINGVTFQAYAVPVKNSGGTDLTPGTNEWQQAVAGMDIDDAQAAIGSSPTAVRTGTTATHPTYGQGVIVWESVFPDVTEEVATDAQGLSLPRGLYLVRETGTPAGVVASGDFLIAVPLTHPTTLNAWLDKIFVYPKNRTLEGEKTVENAQDYTVGSTVTWTIDLDNPSVRDQSTGLFVATDKFEIYDTLVDAELTTTVAGVNVNVPTGLIKGTDYTVAVVAGTGAAGNGIAVGSSQVQIVFESTGRTKLAAAMNDATPVDNVEITLDTVVNKVGVIQNSAQFYSSTAQTTPKTIPGTEVRYGNVTLVKESTDTSIVDFTGAEFRVYLTEQGAQNKVSTPYVPVTNPNGYLVTTENATGLWTTDQDGEISVGGFRYSGYADGESFDTLDSRYQTYWLAETKALPGHQLLGQPVSFTVDSYDGSHTVTVKNSTEGGFVLPLTGGMGTALLTIGGIAILAIVLIVVARRRNENVAAE